MSDDLYLIKPIPTVYRGITFHSQVEARVAIAFDASELRWDWVYEPQGYETEGGWYQPDFKVWRSGLDGEPAWSARYIEVKHDDYPHPMRGRDLLKLRDLAVRKKTSATLLRGLNSMSTLITERGDVLEQNNFPEAMFWSSHAVQFARNARFGRGQTPTYDECRAFGLSNIGGVPLPSGFVWQGQESWGGE